MNEEGKINVSAKHQYFVGTHGSLSPQYSDPNPVTFSLLDVTFIIRPQSAMQHPQNPVWGPDFFFHTTWTWTKLP